MIADLAAEQRTLPLHLVQVLQNHLRRWGKVSDNAHIV